MDFFKRWIKTYTPFWILLLLPIVLQLPDLTGKLSSDPVFFTASVGDSARQAGGVPWIDPNVGYQAQALGKLSADQWLNGQIPWWNSYSGIGLPLAAEAQPGSLFLPIVLLMHYRHGGAWVELLMQIIAGLCTYALLRKLRLSKLAALAGAALFELNGTFAWHGAPIVTPMAFLPMLLLGVESLRERVESGAKGGWWLIPLALAWSIYAGFPETAYIDGLLAAVWVLTRISDMSANQKLRFLSKLFGAALVGVLLSLPLIIPFVEYLTLSVVGKHGDGFAHAALPFASLPLSLMPWLYGPIFLYDDPSHAILVTWSNIGGYLTALQFTIVLLGMFFSGQKLYFVLLGWMLVCLAKTFDIAPINDLVNLLPLIKSTAFFRYSPPSWEFSAAICIALAIHGIQQRLAVSKRRIYFAFAVTMLISAGAIWLNRSSIEALRLLPGYSRFFRSALIWLLISTGFGLFLLMFRNRWKYAVRGLVSLLILDACISFALPIRSGARDLRQHEEGVKFLQQHTGMQRTYSLGPLSPNYGAFFKVAQINHNYLPISKNWIDYIHEHLDPQADAITFLGNTSRASNRADSSELLRAQQSAYEALGIKYVIAPAGTNPFVLRSRPTALPSSGPAISSELSGSTAINVRWRLPKDGSLNVTGLNVLIGNYNNKADGWLSVKLCLNNSRCIQGERQIKGALDNQPFSVRFPQPFAISTTDAEEWLTVTLSQRAGTQPVAVWLQSADQGQHVAMSEAPRPGFAPVINLELADDQTQLVRVYAGTDMAIYELPHPKPYYEVSQGNCLIQPYSRTKLLADCSTPAKLVRREAFYPGWYAAIDDVRNPIERRDEIFQGIALPQGRHVVEFRYRPTYSAAISLGLLAGMIALLLGIYGDCGRSRRHSTAL